MIPNFNLDVPERMSSASTNTFSSLLSQRRGASNNRSSCFTTQCVLPCHLRAPRYVAMKAMASQRTGSSGEPLQKPSKTNQTMMQRRTPASSLGGIWELFPLKWILQQMLETTDKFMHDPCYCNGITFLDLQSKETVDCCRSKQRWKIEEDDGGLHRLRFETPGVTKEDVKVWVEARILYVEAKKKAEEEEDRRHTERRYDAKFTLPHDADAEKIKAEMKEGVLYVTIPTVSPSSKVLNIDVR